MKKTGLMVLAMLLILGTAEAANYTVEVERGWFSRKPYLRIVAENGKVVAHGETLENFLDAMDTAQNLAEGKFEVVDKFHKMPEGDR